MKFCALALLVLSLGAQAANVAIIDSGLDTQHGELKNNIWKNALEVDDVRDNDGNGYQDDVHGWNFAEQNSILIDYKYKETNTPDTLRTFEINSSAITCRAT